MDRKLRLKQTTTVGNVTFINERSRQHFVIMQASNRALALATSPELLGAGSTVMTQEAFEVLKEAAEGRGLAVGLQLISVDDALILCDLPMTKEDIMAVMYPSKAVAH